MQENPERTFFKQEAVTFVSLRTRAVALFASFVFLISSNGSPTPPRYTVLNPISQGNLTVFPVTASSAFNTAGFITLDEGIRPGKWS